MTATRTAEGKVLGCQRCGFYEPSMDFINKELTLILFNAFDAAQMKRREFKKKYCHECMSKLAGMLNEFDKEIFAEVPPGMGVKDKQLREDNEMMLRNMKAELLKDMATADGEIKPPPNKKKHHGK